MLVRMRGWRRRLGLGRVAKGERSAPRAYLTQEQFQEELVVLGLSHQTFGPREYAAALGGHMGLDVCIDVVADSSHPLLSRELARTGITGEILYRAEQGRAHVVVPGSLPPLALVFTLLHELGHLAGGDLFVDAEGELAPSLNHSGFPTLESAGKKRLARNPPFAYSEHREHEADLRAGYAFVAGCLGNDNPYAQRMYDVL